MNFGAVGHSQRRIITLRPGEMSLHLVRLVHGSPPNPSNDRRIGFAAGTLYPLPVFPAHQNSGFPEAPAPSGRRGR